MQCGRPQFAADAAHLEAAKRRCRIEDIVAVHPDRSGPDMLGEVMGLAHITRPDGGGQAIERLVRPLNDFIRLFERQHAEHRPEDFVRGDGHVVRHVVENGGLNVEALASGSLAPRHAGRPGRVALVDVAQDLVELVAVHLRPLHRVGFKRIANLSLAGPRDQFVHELGVDLFLNKHAAARAAALSLVEEQAEFRASDGGVQVGVGEDHVGTLAPQFKRQPFQCLSGIDHDDLRGAMLTGESDLVDFPMLDHGRAGRRSITRHDVDHASGEAGFESQFPHSQGRQRSLFGGLQDDRAAGGQGRTPLPRQHQQREVPGNDLTGHTHRLAAGVAKIVPANRDRVAGQFIGPAGIVPQAVDRQRQVGRAAVADRLAVVQGFQGGKFFQILLHQIGQLEQHAAAVPRIHPGPGTGFKRLAGRFGRQVDIGGITLGDLRDDLFRRGIHRGERLAAEGLAPFAVDEKFRLPNLGSGHPGGLGFRLRRDRGHVALLG